MVTTTQLSPSGSLVEAHEVCFSINCICEDRITVINPLGTDFDPADIYITSSELKLESSPFLHSWTTETEQQFLTKDGIWLYSHSKKLILIFGKGDRDSLLKNCGEGDAGHAEFSLFFPVPPNLVGTKDNSIRVVVTCMN